MSASISGIRRTLLFFALLFVAPVFTSAADFPPVSKDELNLKDAPGYPGADAMVLYHEETDDDNMHYEEVYVRIKIFTEAGRDRANVQIPYPKFHGASLGEVKGRTTHADGSIVNFEGKPMDKVIEKGRDYKVNVKAFTLPDVQVGSIIEYRYTFRYDDNALVPPHWVVQNDMLQRKVHFVYKPYMDETVDRHGVVSRGIKWTFQLPKNTEPKYIQNQCNERTNSAMHGCVSIVYDANDIPPFVEEPFMPPSDILKSYISFYYDSNRKQEEFWKSEGKYWTKDIDSFLGDEKALRDELAKIVSSADSPEQKVRKIYDYVGTYKNLTYSRRLTLQERQTIGFDKKYNVGKVINAKTGDREDLNRLFIGLVRMAGIPAYAMRVTARDDSYFVPQVLSWSQLDMELAIVSLNGKEVFLDPGTKFCPYGLLYWKLTGANGVRQSASGKGTEIAPTPQPGYKDAQIKRVANFTLQDDGIAKGTLQVTFFSQEALIRRIRASKTDAEGSTKMIEDEVKKWLPSTAEVSLSNKPGWEQVDQPLIAEFSVSTPLLTSAGKRQLLPLHPFNFNNPAPFPNSTRKYTVYMEFPCSSIDELRLKLPSGMSPAALPSNETISLGYAYLATQYVTNGRELISSAVMALGDYAFDVKQYADIKGFYEKAKTAYDQQLVLSGGTSAQGK